MVFSKTFYFKTEADIARLSPQILDVINGVTHEEVEEEVIEEEESEE